MKRFINKYTQKVTGTIECFDRLLFKGHLPISWSGSMENFMSNQGLLIKDFGKFVSHHSEHVKVHAKAMAGKEGRPFIWIEDSGRAQRLADHFVRKNWPRILSSFARRVNPLMKKVSTQSQAFATNISAKSSWAIRKTGLKYFARVPASPGS